MATARQESLVDNLAALRAARRISDITFLDLPNARHEIIMERDGTRGVFLKAFDNLAARVNMAPA
jgi:alpha-beta hydrolase superfamily lysophospholipase